MSRGNSTDGNPELSQLRPAAPAGLQSVFALIALNEHENSAAARYADHAYPHAERIISELRAHGDYETLIAELQQATITMYSHEADGVIEPEHQAIMAGYYTGFAVCWLLLMAVNGH